MHVLVPLNFTCEEFINLMVIALFSYLDADCKYMYLLKCNFLLEIHDWLERCLGLPRQRLVELQLLMVLK